MYHYMFILTLINHRRTAVGYYENKGESGVVGSDAHPSTLQREGLL